MGPRGCTCASPGSGPSREWGESGGWLATMEGKAPRPMQPLRRALMLWSSLPHWVSVPAYHVCRLLPRCPSYLLQFACGSIPYCLEVLPRWPVLEDASSDQDISLYNPYPQLCDLCYFIYFFLCSTHYSHSKIGIFTLLFSLLLLLEVNFLTARKKIFFNHTSFSFLGHSKDFVSYFRSGTFLHAHSHYLDPSKHPSLELPPAEGYFCCILFNVYPLRAFRGFSKIQMWLCYSPVWNHLMFTHCV